MASNNGTNGNGRSRGLGWLVGDQTGEKDKQQNTFNPPQVVNQNGIPIASWNTSYDKANFAEYQARQTLAPPSSLEECFILPGWVAVGAGLKNFVRILLLTNPALSAPVIILGGACVLIPVGYFATGFITGNSTIKLGTGYKAGLTLLGALFL